MTGKQHVLTLLEKMPEEATLGHIVRWVNLLDLIGAGHGEADEFDADFESDLMDFYAKEKRKKAIPDHRINNLDIFKNQSVREKCISIVKSYPDDLPIHEILYRLTVVKKIAESLADGDEGAMEHDAFFKQLEKEDEENNQDRLAGARPKRLAPTAKLDRRGRPSNGAKIRARTEGSDTSA